MQRVEIPVPVSCIDQIPARPQLITDAELMELQPGQFVTALHVDRLKRDGYQANLEALLEGCL
ncbi:hypothetical protein [Methylobacillus flagellatus]|uniref:hypothetical protein n=1 Tax=Methylobacillus flagellatus TaxID=405 RepID=UPI0010F9171B|nr:hypothetical protein [Methylobacillus flagellatus]